MVDSAESAGDARQRALLDEVLKKCALVWVRLEGRGHPRWHAWLDGHVYLLTGPGEQPDPGLTTDLTVRVIARSKDSRHRVIAFDADVARMEPTDPDWAPATTELARLRLNLSEAEQAPGRWAEPGFTIYRLSPRLPLAEDADDVPTDSHREAPAATEATTAGPRPYVLHRRHGSGRPLS